MTGIDERMVCSAKEKVEVGPVIPLLLVIAFKVIVGVIFPELKQSILNAITSFALAEVRSGSDEQKRNGSGIVTRLLGMLSMSTFVLN